MAPPRSLPPSPQSVIAGYNGTVLACKREVDRPPHTAQLTELVCPQSPDGQTGAGKTYTIEGAASADDSSATSSTIPETAPQAAAATALADHFMPPGLQAGRSATPPPPPSPPANLQPCEDSGAEEGFVPRAARMIFDEVLLRVRGRQLQFSSVGRDVDLLCLLCTRCPGGEGVS